MFRLSGLFEFESNCGIVETRVDRVEKKEGKAGGGGVGMRGWLVWSQDGARRAHERGQTANQL